MSEVKVPDSKGPPLDRLDIDLVGANLGGHGPTASSYW